MFDSDTVTVARGGLEPSDPRWETDQVNDAPPCVSFPTRAVLVEKEGMDPFVASANRVSLFNHGQTFRLRRVGPHATRSVRFYFNPAAISDAFGPRAGWTDDPARPFPASSAIIGHTTFLAQRAVELSAAHNPDPLLMEELATRILHDAADAIDGGPRLPKTSSRTREAHREAVQAVEACIAQRFGERLTLSVIASAARCAPTHLCRIYRSHTGITIHQSLTRHRLRRALEMLSLPRYDSNAVADACGFSSRSHLSDAMFRGLGVRPSELRPAPRAARALRARLAWGVSESR
ncbi:MAG: AraC family transcriptional regulator [Phycisphaerales bacterium]